MLIKVKPYKLPAFNTVQVEPRENILIRVQRKLSMSIIGYLCPILIIAPWMYISAYLTLNSNQESIYLLKRFDSNENIFKDILPDKKIIDNNKTENIYLSNRYIPTKYKYTKTNKSKKATLKPYNFHKRDRLKSLANSLYVRLPVEAQNKQSGEYISQDGGYSTNSDELSVYMDGYGITLKLGDAKLYHRINTTTKRTHSGIHLLALHEETHKILYSSVFQTGAPSAAAMLERALDAIQPGRILIMLAMPDWMNWLQYTSFLSFVKLGAYFGIRGAQGEPWLLVTHKGHRRLAEILISIHSESIQKKLVDIDVSKNDAKKSSSGVSYNSTSSSTKGSKSGKGLVAGRESPESSPFAFSMILPHFRTPSCAWHQDPSYSARAAFCQTYEGYGDFCDCHQPLQLSPTKAPPRMDLEIDVIQTIPIALVTAKRLTNVLRQVQQIWSLPGGGETPLGIFVDGYNPEAEHLGHILNITTVIHYDNPAPIGNKHRVNQHIKFSLEGILKLYPEVDKVIILEDDLVLAEDFISYFHQAAILLDFDSSTLMCVNAYNYNAFPHVAKDPAKIYRVQSYPYYGWMVKRKEAESMLQNWAPLDVDADWDYFLRREHLKERQVIIPEIPRTRHEGGGGMHVSGVIQELTYNQRLLNKIPNVQLSLKRTWLFAYSLDMQRALDQATVINITQHPCDKAPLPRDKNSSYVIYGSMQGETDRPHTWKLIAKCLGFYPDIYEHFHGIFSVKFFNATLYAVGCPASPYCDEARVDPSVIYTPTKEDFLYARRHQWVHSNISSEIAMRIQTSNPQDEFLLKNYVYAEMMITQLDLQEE